MPLNFELPDGRSCRFSRPAIMGILNVTPDSFSDGGRYLDPSVAVDHAVSMLDDGADIIDVGGESTRPGAQRVSVDEQAHRVVPVIEALCQRVPDVIVSVDTTQSLVARAAIDAGAVIINDVSASCDDPEMFGLAAQRGVLLILMHMRGTPRDMQDAPRYSDVAGEVKSFLVERAQGAIDAGVKRGQIVIDPGIGFGKTVEHNLRLMSHLDRLVATGFPVLLGASRKRVLRHICQGQGGRGVPKPSDLTAATCATTVLGVASGVNLFRVHDVRANRRAADTAWSIVTSGAGS